MKSNDKSNEISIKNRMCYCFDDKIKFEDFELDKTLIDVQTHENVLVYNISYKTLIGAKPIHIRFDRKIDLLGFMMKLDTYYHLELKNMI